MSILQFPTPKNASMITLAQVVNTELAIHALGDAANYSGVSVRQILCSYRIAMNELRRLDSVNPILKAAHWDDA